MSNTAEHSAGGGALEGNAAEAFLSKENVLPLLDFPNQDSRHHVEYYVDKDTGTAYRSRRTSEYNSSTGDNDYTTKVTPVTKDEVKKEYFQLIRDIGLDSIGSYTAQKMEEYCGVLVERAEKADAMIDAQFAKREGTVSHAKEVGEGRG